MSLVFISSAILLLSAALFICRRTMRYLHIYQQEEYDSQRFIKWMITTCSFDKYASLAIFFVAILPQIIDTSDAYHMTFSAFINGALSLLFLILSYFEENPLKAAKKPLVLTLRANRILMITGMIMAAIVLTILSTSLPHLLTPLMWIVVIQAIPFSLVIANILLSPFEKSVKARFRAEAVKKLDEINPFIIGITGSYGKTSVKHMLGHVLEFYAPTLFTPGSVNTEMGIARVIREQLGPQHKYFIVEMGAYGIGSIARLCKFTPPKLSIITAIGPAHYERFKTLEDTARAKSEIAEAALAQNGQVIVHQSVLAYARPHQLQTSHEKDFITVGENGDVRIVSANETRDGLTISLSYKGKEYTIVAPIFGRHHADNIAVVFAAATTLGMAPEHIIMALKSVPQVAHRLEVKRFTDHTLIDDAYNSNPKGFAAALTLLDLLGKDTRRILVTPGMVEMGDDHDTAHAQLGQQAAQCADIIIAVAPNRIRSFVNAFLASKDTKQILVEVASFNEARAWLQSHQLQGDVILLENDLPDVYERRFRA